MATTPTALLLSLVALLLGMALGAAVTSSRHRGALIRAAELRATESAQHAASVGSALTPIADQLDRLEAQVQRADRERLAADATLGEHLRAVVTGADQVRTEAARLSRSLGRSDVRGHWGELSLVRLVEAAGMVEHVDFRTQVTMSGFDGDGAQRPDAIIDMSNGRHLVIDAKVPLTAYLDAIEATDGHPDAADLQQHAASVLGHVQRLGAKAYWRRVGSPEFVVMYLPAESLLSAALHARPDLLEVSFRNNVIIASPSTLLALLRTVAHSWQTAAAARNAAAVQEIGRELHQRLSTALTHLGRVGTSLDSSVQAYNKAIASLETRVLVSARRLADLGAVDASLPDAGLAAPPQVAVRSRTPRAAADLEDVVETRRAEGLPELGLLARSSGPTFDDAVAISVQLDDPGSTDIAG